MRLRANRPAAPLPLLKELAKLIDDLACSAFDNGMPHQRDAIGLPLASEHFLNLQSSTPLFIRDCRKLFLRQIASHARFARLQLSAAGQVV